MNPPAKGLNPDLKIVPFSTIVTFIPFSPPFIAAKIPAYPPPITRIFMLILFSLAFSYQLGQCFKEGTRSNVQGAREESLAL